MCVCVCVCVCVFVCGGVCEREREEKQESERQRLQGPKNRKENQNTIALMVTCMLSSKLILYITVYYLLHLYELANNHCMFQIES